MGALSDSRVGMVMPGQLEMVMSPRNRTEPSRYPAFQAHGAGSGPDAMMNYGGAGERNSRLTDSGVTLFSGAFGGPQTWGNDAAMKALDATYAWLQTQPNVRKGKIVGIGGSMGGCNSLNWAARNRDKVVCLSLTIPVLDMNGIWSGNLQGLRSYINSSYSGAYNPSTMGKDRDPLTLARAGRFDGLPIRLHYAESDPICLKEKALEFASIVGTVELHRLVGGHEESAERGINRAEEAAWILEHSE